MNSVGNAIHSFTVRTCNKIQVKTKWYFWEDIVLLQIKVSVSACDNSCYNNAVPFMFLLSSGQSSYILSIINKSCAEDGKQVSYQNVKTTKSKKTVYSTPGPFSNKYVFTWICSAPFGHFLKRRGPNTFMRCNSHYAKPTLYKTLMIWCVSVCVG